MEKIHTTKVATVINNKVDTKVKKVNHFKKKNRALFIFSIPATLLLLIFSYLPMFGLVLAFKDFRYDQGILGSRWVGLDNFKFFFTSQDAWRVTRNTIGYNLIFIVTMIVGSVIIAMMLNEVKNRFMVKTYQTIFFFPYFLSWAVVAFMAYAFFNVEYGILNRILSVFLHVERVLWYSDPTAWIYILPILSFWKGFGYNAIIFYAGLMSIDSTYYEAAAIDGATKFQMAMKITLPHITPLITIMSLLMVGKIFRSDFGLFYIVPRDAGALYSTIDVIDTYVFRSLRVSGDVGMSTAIGLYQSVVGFFVVVFTNWLVKKYDADNAMF